MRHKAREMLVSQRTQLLNGFRGHLTEVGVIAPQGPRHARELAELIEACDETIPFEVCEALAPLVVQLRNLDEAIARLERHHRQAGAEGRNGAPADEHSRLRTRSPPRRWRRPFRILQFRRPARVRRLSRADAQTELFRRQARSSGAFRRWAIGTCANCSSSGAHAVLFHRKPHTDPLRMWAKKLIEKKPFKLVAVALANKMARIAFAIMRRQDSLSRKFRRKEHRLEFAAEARQEHAGSTGIEGDQEVMRRRAD